MDLKHLDYIIAISEEKNISRAAEKLYISQPTLSLYLIKLEKELGVTLFNRVKNAMTLTYAGEIYVKSAKEILNRKKNTENLIEDIIDYKKGRLTIGFAPDRGSTILPFVIPDFKKMYPGIELILIEETAKELEALTLKGLIDITFIVYYDHELQLAYDTLFTEEIILAVPKSHDLAVLTKHSPGGEKNKIDLSLLKNEPFVLMNQGTKIRQIQNDIFKDSNFVPEIFIESKSIPTVLNLTANGGGLTIMPEKMAIHMDYSKNLVFFSIGQKKYFWPIIAAYRKDYYMTRAASDFTSLVRSFLSNGFNS